MTEAATAALVGMRPAGPGDEGFIYAKWLKSYRRQANDYGIIASTYWDGQHALIEKILKANEALVIVINGEDVGFLVHGHRRLQFVFVKDLMRGLGVASAAVDQLDPAPFGYTHDSQEIQWRKLVDRRRLQFDPYGAWL